MVTLVAVLALAVLAGTPALQAQAARLTCGSGRTLAQRGHTRVFFVGTQPSGDAYACLMPGIKPLRLIAQDPGYGPLVAHVSLSGRFVAFEAENTFRDAGGAVYVIDLALRRVRVRESWGIADAPDVPAGIGPAVALRVGSTGAVAWVGQDASGNREVRLLDDRGQTLLATGVDIVPSSLAVSATSVRWTGATGARRVQVRAKPRPWRGQLQ